MLNGQYLQEYISKIALLYKEASSTGAPRAAAELQELLTMRVRSTFITPPISLQVSAGQLSSNLRLCCMLHLNLQEILTECKDFALRGSVKTVICCACLLAML